jgi:hypothetical protein
MKITFISFVVFGAMIMIACGALDTAKIDSITGLKGKLSEKEGVYRVTFPRADVKVAVDGWTMPPFMGLGTWAAFTQGSHTEAMVMGDTVIFEDEANPAMSAALENGLSVTALHNHFFFDHPKVYFMHIEGQGTVEELATAVRKVYDRIKEIRAANPQPKDSFGGTAVIDRDKGEVIATWRTGLAFGNFPMALDETNHRLFVGCRLPSKLVVLDTESGKVVASVGISGDPDDVFYDSKRHRMYAICGAGKIDIIEQTDANNYKAVTQIDTAEGARTGLFVPERDNLFVAVPRRGGQSAEIRCYQIK